MSLLLEGNVSAFRIIARRFTMRTRKRGRRFSLRGLRTCSGFKVASGRHKFGFLYANNETTPLSEITRADFKPCLMDAHVSGPTRSLSSAWEDFLRESTLCRFFNPQY